MIGDCPLCVASVNPSCPICNGTNDCPIAMGGIARKISASSLFGKISKPEVQYDDCGDAITPARKATESNPMVRFRDGKRTRSIAIKAKCCECMGCTYDAIEPGFRGMIRECTSFGCPLHEFRPFQRSETDDDEQSTPD